MVATTTGEILLRALHEGLGDETNTFIMLEKIGTAIQKWESPLDPAERIAGKATTALIELEKKGLAKMTQGKVRLTEAGEKAADELELPHKWDGLPKTIKRFVLRQF